MKLNMTPARTSVAIYTTIALTVAGAFLAATTFRGDYDWVARLGGAGWVFLLSMIILMPTVTPWVKKRLGRSQR
jgi:hypothetical protein